MLQDFPKEGCSEKRASHPLNTQTLTSVGVKVLETSREKQKETLRVSRPSLAITTGLQPLQETRGVIKTERFECTKVLGYAHRPFLSSDCHSQNWEFPTTTVPDGGYKTCSVPCGPFNEFSWVTWTMSYYVIPPLTKFTEDVIAS